MALKPLDERHAAQIAAGTVGRRSGHSFEEQLAKSITVLGQKPFQAVSVKGHLLEGVPAVNLLNYIATSVGMPEVLAAEAWWFGGLATAGRGHRAIPGTDIVVKRSKSDVFIRLTGRRGEILTGVGVKTCNKQTPTNAQVFFTTAQAFCDLLERRIATVSPVARDSMRMFCGDVGFRPLDLGGPSTASGERYFWEETPPEGQKFWAEYLTLHQHAVTELLLKFAYEDDPVPPDFLMHQRVRPVSSQDVPIAVFSIEEFVRLSALESSFTTRPYRVLKGSGRNPDVVHQAPRFGFMQFQRGGQRQHPTQLQFNLKAGYFNSALA